MPYNEKYSDSETYFGSRPSDVLVRHLPLLDKNRPMLDVGAGQGRNAIFLARNGFCVDAIEPSSAGAESMRSIARNDRIPLRVHETDFETFHGRPGSYSGVLIFGLIQELKRPQIRLLCKKVIAWLCPRGLALVSAHTTQDPSFGHRTDKECIGRNSFSLPGGGVYTYLEANEILQVFQDLECIYHWEGLGSVHRHGRGKLERHGSAVAVFRCSKK
jgi:cyclopropane fatty-acyl-phospholipid synthase-like methyltransferase